MSRIIITSPQIEGQATLEVKVPEFDGWWSSQASTDPKYKITEARLGQTVYFILKTKGVPDDAVLKLQLFNLEKLCMLFDYLKPDKYKFGNKVQFAETVVSNKTAVIELELPESWTPDVKEDSGVMELYWRTKYLHFAEKHLPVRENDYLNVRYSDRDLYISPSKIDAAFPEMYSLDGFPLVVGVIGGVHDMAKENIKTAVKKHIGKIALTKLEKGYLVDSNGKLYGGTTRQNWKRPVTEREVYTNEGIKVKTRMGRNFTLSDGATTKGIDQVGHFATHGIKVKMIGLLKNLGNIFSVLDLVDIMKMEADQDSFAIPLPGANVMGMMIDTKFEQMEEAFEQRRHEELEEAKAQGLKAVEAWVKRYGDNSKGIIYQLMKITKEAALEILQGKLNILEKIDLVKTSNQDKEIVFILYRLQIDQVRNKKIYIIETFYVDV